MDNRDVKISLDIVANILDILNEEIENLKNRVAKLEATNSSEEYNIIKIPVNASNLDVLRKVFDCKIINIDTFERGIAHIDIDDDTLFNTRWLKSKYKGGCGNETNK